MNGMIGRRLDDTLDARTAERLSTRLRLARHMRGMTLKVLADAASCSESLLSKIENGKAYPSLPMLNRLVQALGIGMGWMFDDQEGREPVIARSGQRSATAALEAVGGSITLERVIPDSATTCSNATSCMSRRGPPATRNSSMRARRPATCSMATSNSSSKAECIA